MPFEEAGVGGRTVAVRGIMNRGGHAPRMAGSGYARLHTGVKGVALYQKGESDHTRTNDAIR